MNDDEIAAIRSRQTKATEYNASLTLVQLDQARADIRYLLGEVARVQAEVVELRQALSRAIKEIGTDMRYVSAETEQQIRAPLIAVEQREVPDAERD